MASKLINANLIVYPDVLIVSPIVASSENLSTTYVFKGYFTLEQKKAPQNARLRKLKCWGESLKFLMR